MPQQLRHKPAETNHFAPATLTETELVQSDVQAVQTPRHRFPWARLLGVAACLSVFTGMLCWHSYEHSAGGEKYLWGFYGVTGLTTFLWGWRSRRWEGALSVPLLAITTMATLILYLRWQREPLAFYPELLRLVGPMSLFGVLGCVARISWNKRRSRRMHAKIT